MADKQVAKLQIQKPQKREIWIRKTLRKLC